MFCPNACGMCDLKVNRALRCDRKRLKIPTEPIYEPGDMNRIFKKLATAPEYQKYKPEVLHKDPYIIKFHNFVSDEEIDALRTQTKGKFERSTDQGEFDEFGKQEKVTSKGRTSSNAWCTHQCEDDLTVRGLSKRIEEAVEIPYGNFESFQVLDYGIGQVGNFLFKFTTHNFY